MESPPNADFPGEESFDSSRPLHGLVLCCTSIEADQRSEIARRTAEMGGVHKYDLTPDVTHLIVGDYNTAKYRHVAKERADIKAMAAGWLDDVRELWVGDQDIDFIALENKWKLKAFESSGGIPNDPVPQARERSRLVCCLTGFEDYDTRNMIEDKVTANGGEYVGDLSKKVTHLIVCKPEGKKYAAARKWGIRCVSIEWLNDSIERGMILQEECYDPNLPLEERGNGAWNRKTVQKVSLGKRSRDGTATVAEEGRRKLRKSASMRMSTQRENLWGDILVNHSNGDLSKPNTMQREQSTASITIADSVDRPAEDIPPIQPPETAGSPFHERGVFSACRFYVHGFSQPKTEIVCAHLASHGATTSPSLEDAASPNHLEPLDRRYLVVPQISQPDTHPRLPEGVHIITEFFLERCIHNKTLFAPHDHVLGQPFPRFPIDGFQQLSIGTAGFADEQLNQVEKTITQLGAKFAEIFNAQASLLVCPALDRIRPAKLDCAILSDIPVVKADWLWQCISAGSLVPWDNYVFDEISDRANSLRAQRRERTTGGDKLQRTRSEPSLREAKSNDRPPPRKSMIDTAGFDDDDNNDGHEAAAPRPGASATPREEAGNSYYETAPSHHVDPMSDGFASTPLAEVGANALNKTMPSPTKPAQPAAQRRARKLKRFPTGGEVGDSEGGEESDAAMSEPSRLEASAARDKDEAAAAAAPARITRDEAAAREQEQEQGEEETERRRRREQARAAERREMSRRLNSLVPTAVSGGGSSGVAALKNLQAGVGAHPPPPRRKREILGRAASNVSAGSSGSADSTSQQQQQQQQQLAGSSSSSLARARKQQQRQDSTHSAGGTDEPPSAPGAGVEAGASANVNDDLLPPPATQVGYGDPDATRHREALMNRINGVQPSAAAARRASSSEDKITFADLNANMNMNMNMTGTTAAGTRSRRTATRQG
ncbi:hypothetical protein GGR56DRAFT_296465 [Xylariaceae sp. FL0804]|nr:hypothetical protein GGR56DRAFT_296465 [Xylariaceae sp. FL0804]